MVPNKGILAAGDMDSVMSKVYSIDARGKRCPMPMLLAKRAIHEQAHAGSLEILATDPSAPKDFETFARLEGHTVSWERDDDLFTITLTLNSLSTGERA